MIEVSVIVPHYRDLRGLDRCLAALGAQSMARSRFEVVVADNGSPEGVREVERVVAGRAKVVVVDERGAGPARNGGVAASRGAVLAFTDSDCVPEPQWLAAGVEALARHDFVGGRVEMLVDDPRHPTPVEAFERVFGFDFETYITKKGFTGSGNLFVSRAVFDAVGGFRAQVSEDVDWSRRARAAGYRLGYAPDAVVGHPARRNWADLRSKWRRVNSESFHLMLGRRYGRAKWLGRSLLMPVSAVIHTPRVLRSPKLPTVSARLGALGILYASRWWRLADGGALGLGLRR